MFLMCIFKRCIMYREKSWFHHLSARSLQGLVKRILHILAILLSDCFSTGEQTQLHPGSVGNVCKQDCNHPCMRCFQAAYPGQGHCGNSQQINPDTPFSKQKSLAPPEGSLWATCLFESLFGTVVTATLISSFLKKVEKQYCLSIGIFFRVMGSYWKVSSGKC